METTTPVLEFFDDPAAFLASAGEFLAADPVLVTVVATVTQRCLGGEVAAGNAPRWWVTVRERGQGDDIAAVGMRTAPGGASPPYLTAMSDAAARALARALIERREVVTQVNGALPAARVMAEEAGLLTGGAAHVVEHTRLHLLSSLREPTTVLGRLRHATPDDLEVCLAWWEDFEIDAASQAGRPPDAPLEPQDAETMLDRIARGRVVVWEDDHGDVVHLTGVNPPSYGVVRVGPVYTPSEQRGRGYASATVAAVSAAAQRDGHQVCLFTDQANPISNKIYAALGFEPVVDMAHLEIT